MERQLPRIIRECPAVVNAYRQNPVVFGPRLEKLLQNETSVSFCNGILTAYFSKKKCQ
jgi:hypothetical protein